MSTNLYWRPYSPASGKTLPVGLKWALLKRYFQDNWGPLVVNQEDRHYFEGLLDAEMEGAAEILKFLDKYDALELWISE